MISIITSALPSINITEKLPPQPTKVAIAPRTAAMSPSPVPDANEAPMSEPPNQKETTATTSHNKWLQPPKLKSSQNSCGRSSVAYGALRDGDDDDGFITVGRAFTNCGRDEKSKANQQTSADKAKSKAVQQESEVTEKKTKGGHV